MALQRWGDVDMEHLITAMRENGAMVTPLSNRAAAADCVSRGFLGNAQHAKSVLDILGKITSI